MLKQNLGRLTGKTEPTEKFRKLSWRIIHVSSFLSVNGISALAIMKKLKNGCHFININRMEKCQITDTPPKFGSPVFQVLTKTEYQHQPLWKNWKMAATSLISIVWKNFKLLTPPKSLGLWFSKCGFPSVNRNRISASAIMKKMKNGCHFVNIECTKNFKLPTLPPQSLGLWFSKCQQKWNISVGHYEKNEKCLPFC